MDYTAEQMAKMIVLAETLLRYNAMLPIKLQPVVQISFNSFNDASTFELAVDEAVNALRPTQLGITPSRV